MRAAEVRQHVDGHGVRAEGADHHAVPVRVDAQHAVRLGVPQLDHALQLRVHLCLVGWASSLGLLHAASRACDGDAHPVRPVLQLIAHLVEQLLQLERAAASRRTWPRRAGQEGRPARRLAVALQERRRGWGPRARAARPPSSATVASA